MTHLRALIGRLMVSFQRRRIDTALDEEIRLHLDHLEHEHRRRGLSPEAAREAARREFGSVAQVQENHRDQYRLRFVEDLCRDAAYSARQLRRSPVFTAAAALCLGLGIGATTAIYSVVNAVLLQPLPFTDSDRLARVTEHFAANGSMFQRGITHQEFLDWRTRIRSFSDATAIVPYGQRVVDSSHGPVGLWGAAASPNAFTFLGVRAMLGRTLVAGDDVTHNVVVLSFDTWQRHFDGDPAVVGRTVTLRAGALEPPLAERLLTVVGVLPADFELPFGPLDYYIPLVPPAPSRPSRRVVMIGRLAPGVSLDTAVDEVNILGAAVRPPWPADGPALTTPRFELEPLKDAAIKDLRPALRVLLAAVVVVLLIVCANVANLLLARGTGRQREMEVRLAIGATRARLVRLVMAECLVLAAAGAILGGLTGAAGIVLVKQFTTVDAPGIFRLMFGATILPRAHEVGIGWPVFVTAFGVAAVASVMLGIVPALCVSRRPDARGLGSRGAGRGESRVRAALVVGQLMMATTLLVGAGLLIQSFLRVSAVDSGYNPANVLTVNLLLPAESSIARKATTIEMVLARLRQTSSVQVAGFSRHGLLFGEELVSNGFVPVGRTVEDMRQTRARFRSVSHGFLTASGVAVISGREFTAADAATAPPVVVINRSAARQYFGSTNPVGHVVDWHFRTGQARQLTVVGVVDDVRQTSPTDAVFAEIYLDYRQFLALLDGWQESPERQNELAIGFLSFAVRIAGDPSAAMPVVRQAVSAVDPTIGIDGIIPLESLVASTLTRERFFAVTMGIFAGLAAMLAIIGIYGVFAYTVARRTREIGIRMALGARPGRAVGLVLRQGLVLTTLGIAAGLAGAAILTRYLESLLFGVTRFDTATFVGVAIVFSIVAMLASSIPAQRAARVDPLVALRYE